MRYQRRDNVRRALHVLPGVTGTQLSVESVIAAGQGSAPKLVVRQGARTH